MSLYLQNSCIMQFLDFFYFSHKLRFQQIVLKLIKHIKLIKHKPFFHLNSRLNSACPAQLVTLGKGSVLKPRQKSGGEDGGGMVVIYFFGGSYIKVLLSCY